MKTCQNILISFLFILCCLRSTAFCQPEEYSCQVTQKYGGIQTFSAKIFSAKDRIRIEEPDGKITIIRMDKKVTWIINSKDQEYVEYFRDIMDLYKIVPMAGALARTAKEIEKQANEASRELLGQELVGERVADKYKVIYNIGDKQEIYYQWVDKATGVVLANKSEDNLWMEEFTDINVQKQPDDLFEVPQGYKKVFSEVPPDSIIAPVDFSCDVISKDWRGNQITKKIFVAKDKIRLQKPELVLIVRSDMNKAWFVFPRNKTYFETSYDIKNIIFTGGKFPNEVMRMSLDTETIKDLAVDKYEVMFSFDVGMNKANLWVMKNSGIPLRVQWVDGRLDTEFKNIQIDAQEAALFEIPQGYSQTEPEDFSQSQELRNIIK